MGYIFRRGAKWGIAFENEDGQEVRRIIGTNKKDAEAVLRDVEQLMSDAPSELVLFAEVANHWLSRRRRRGLKIALADSSHLKHHIIPYFGNMEPNNIRVGDIKLFVETLEGKGLAPRTVRNIYSCLHKLFDDLVVDEFLPSTPCVLKKTHLPANIDANPEWRAGAIFHRDEVKQLLKSDLPNTSRTVDIGVRRVLYSLAFYTGGRLSELLALRWRHIHSAEPLDKLIIAVSLEGSTKTKVTRLVPVHPVLAQVLKSWKSERWSTYQGRALNENDLILPSFAGVYIHKSTAYVRLKRDLDHLGLRTRRFHDARRTFITVALEGGARRDVVQRMTHTSKKDMMDLYTTVSWDELCKAILCLDYGIE